MLATSRERPNLGSERLYRLPSLPLDAAAGLFSERARETDAAIALTPADDKLIRDICRRLDGIPLAIELAAARVCAFGIATLHARLDEHMSFTAGRRDLPQRQQTMVATIAWSYALLTEAERAFLRLLAVFSGGFTFDAAERIGADAVHDGDSVRYWLLDSVRAHAAAELQRAGEDRGNHGRHVAGVAGLAYPREVGQLLRAFVLHSWNEAGVIPVVEREPTSPMPWRSPPARILTFP